MLACSGLAAVQSYALGSAGPLRRLYWTSEPAQHPLTATAPCTADKLLVQYELACTSRSGLHSQPSAPVGNSPM